MGSSTAIQKLQIWLVARVLLSVTAAGERINPGSVVFKRVVIPMVGPFHPFMVITHDICCVHCVFGPGVAWNLT